MEAHADRGTSWTLMALVAAGRMVAALPGTVLGEGQEPIAPRLRLMAAPEPEAASTSWIPWALGGTLALPLLGMVAYLWIRRSNAPQARGIEGRRASWRPGPRRLRSSGARCAG